MKASFILLLTLLLYGCSESSQTTTSNDNNSSDSATNVLTFTPTQYEIAGIATGIPQLRTISTPVHVNGIIEVSPENRVSVCFPLGGYVSALKLVPGMKVSKGEVIASMQDQSYIKMQQDYLIAIANFEKISNDYERQKTLNADKSTSDKVFESVKSEYFSQKATVNALEQELLLIGIPPGSLTADNISRTVNILSPINGYVSAVNVNTGQYLAPTDVLFELIDPDEMHVSLTVFGNDVAQIAIGQKVKIKPISNSGMTFEAQITYVGHQLDENNSTELHCEIPSTVQGLLPGMYVKADIETQVTDAICVPTEAVVRMKDSEYIFVRITPFQFQKVKVVTGTTEEQWVEIISSSIPLENREVITSNAWSALMLLENTSQ